MCGLRFTSWDQRGRDRSGRGLPRVSFLLRGIPFFFPLRQADPFCLIGKTEMFVDIPAAVPDGQYLLRVEQIALHDAGYSGGAQFYLGCGQIEVTGGGNGSPGPLVSFPGAYAQDDPGILIDLHGPAPSEYEFPGPEVWQG